MKKSKLLNAFLVVWVYVSLLGIFLSVIDYARLAYYVSRKGQGATISFDFPFTFATTLGQEAAATNIFSLYIYVLCLFIPLTLAMVITLLIKKQFVPFIKERSTMIFSIALLVVLLSFVFDFAMFNSIAGIVYQGKSFSPFHISLVNGGITKTIPILSFFFTLPTSVTIFVVAYHYVKK